MSGRAGVLLSGGLDSTVCMAIARRDCDDVLGVSFDYGQRHKVEVGHAAAVAAHYGVDHVVVPLELRNWSGSALTDAAVDVPAAAEAEAGAADAIPVTYVPARNLIFLSVAVGIAEVRDLDAVYIGVNAVDYSGYPDCRPEFIESFSRTAALALKRGVEGRPVDVRAPLVDVTKVDIIRLGRDLSAPLHLTYSCYRGGDRPCGACDSCRIRAKAFAAAGLDDPAA